MKRKFYFITLMVMIFSFSSCENEEEVSTASNVQITVKDLTGNSISNKTVYMFSDPTTEYTS